MIYFQTKGISLKSHPLIHAQGTSHRVFCLKQGLENFGFHTFFHFSNNSVHQLPLPQSWIFRMPLDRRYSISQMPQLQLPSFQRLLPASFFFRSPSSFRSHHAKFTLLRHCWIESRCYSSSTEWFVRCCLLRFTTWSNDRWRYLDSYLYGS